VEKFPIHAGYSEAPRRIGEVRLRPTSKKGWQRPRSLSPDELSTLVYQDGAQWTVQQVLAHFIAIERSMHWLFKDILSGGKGSPVDFDLDRFNLTQTRKCDGLALDELIERFRAVRLESGR
jgi:hypothetical protein